MTRKRETPERFCPSPATTAPADMAQASTVCCGGAAISRREFVQLAGLGAAALATGSTALAGPFTGQDTADHFVPADKKLQPQWIEQLFAKGSSTWYEGDDLNTIGMPVGGICAGQVYLTGDGGLVFCDIFNQDVNSGYGQINYKVGRRPTEMAAGAGSLPRPTSPRDLPCGSRRKAVRSCERSIARAFPACDSAASTRSATSITASRVFPWRSGCRPSRRSFR